MEGTRGCCDLGEVWLQQAGRGDGMFLLSVSPTLVFFFSTCVGSSLFLLAGGSGSSVCASPAPWSPLPYQVKQLQQLLLVHKLVPFKGGQGEMGERGQALRLVISKEIYKRGLPEALAARGGVFLWLLRNLKFL